MLTGEQSGSLSSPFGPAEEQSLMYRHLLTRLSFALTIEAENTEGFRIRELHLNGLAGEVSLSLATELLTAADETVSVPIYTVEEGGDGLGFTDGKLSLPGYVLVQPSATFTLDLTLAVDDDPRAAYFEQVQNAVYIRMALIMTLLGLKDPKAEKEGT